MKTLLAILFSLALGACATAPSPTRTQDLFADSHFRAPAERIDPDAIFALSEPMRQYLESTIIPETKRKGKHQALFDALYAKNQLKLEYDAAMTRNASQAFAARTGNCLSLVIMTAAFARQLDLQVRFQSVFTEDTWSRAGDLYLSSGHVNLALSHPMDPTRTATVETRQFVIDFLPPADIKGYRTHIISERTIIAMYMNNRAVETLAAARVDDAYWWARAAIEQDASFLPAYNTLGVVMARHGETAEAERVFRHVIGAEPANTAAIANLLSLLEPRGRSTEAAELRQRLARIEPNPPYYYFNLGLKALGDRDFKAARNWFAKEVERAAYQSEFHFGLALANYYLGEVKETEKHLAIALQNATTRSDRDLYATKLERLKKPPAKQQ